MSSNLTVRAGEEALTFLRDGGFDAGAFATMVGASGGPKWLVLSQIDRVLCEHVIRDRTTPLAVVGSSIGTFRHLCFAQHDPRGALDRFENAYIEQAYETEPTPAEVSRESRRIVDTLFAASGRDEVLSNDAIRTHIVAVRSRAPVASESRVPLALGLGASAIANAVDRRLLGAFFERAVFHSHERTVAFRDFGTTEIPLSAANLDDAALASGSIPLVMEGVAGIAGAPTGTYRDGGIVDYHFDFEFEAPEGLILYPHFFDGITPGWFDKSLKWRRPRGPALRRTVLIAPSRTFIDGLPAGRVPDRTDFRRMPTAERQACWRQVVASCDALAQELNDLLATGRLGEIATPLS